MKPIFIDQLRKHGVVGSLRKLIGLMLSKVQNIYFLWRVRNESRYQNATIEELVLIEKELIAAGVMIHDYSPPPALFKTFQAACYFPSDYHGGVDSPFWDEKLLEHWISANLLGLFSYQPADIYVDIAACSSPWAKILRERLNITAFAIDLDAPPPVYMDAEYYKCEDAVSTTFADASIKGASLQCAFEMFMRDDDTNLLRELARILKPGGKAVITPLYMHTHYCAYASPKYYCKGYSDPLAREYVYTDWDGIRSSRFYDVNQFIKRVLKPIEDLGMQYKLLALRNKDKLGQGIYCHFVLECTK